MAIRNSRLFDKVCRAAAGLAGVTEGISWGVPALKVRGVMFVCMATHRSAEPDSLVARLSFVDRDWLVSHDPDVFYLKPHYVNYPCVLVRLKRAKAKELREVVTTAHEFVTSLKSRARRRAR